MTILLQVCVYPCAAGSEDAVGVCRVHGTGHDVLMRIDRLLRRTQPRAVTVGVCAVVSVLAVAACDSERRSDQGQDNISTEERNRFEKLPRHPRSDPLGELTEVDGSLVRSFTTENTTPATVIQYLTTALENRGWEAVEGPHRVGPVAFRGTWTRERSQVLVSAGPAPTVDQDDASVNDLEVQYSFTLSSDEPEQSDRV